MPGTRDLARSTPFRVAVTFAGFLIAAFLLSGLVVYQVMNAELTDRIDEDLQKTFAVLSATYELNDLEDFVKAVQSHSDLASDNDQLFSLIDAHGVRLAGNLPAIPGLPLLTFESIPAEALGLDSEHDYRIYSGTVAGATLTLAFSYGETDELRVVVLSAFAWAILIAAGLAVLGGALLATRVQRRLDTIAMTMNEVSRGRLDARIPLIGNHDDIDVVSSQVNAALDRIVALMEGLRQVGVDIAHDLRTPLNRLRITLESAMERADAPEMVACLEEATAEIDQATQTFDALLRIAQIEAGARKSRFRPLDLAQILINVHEAYEEVAIDAGRDLEIVADPVPAIQGDRDLLIQMIANLVENALRHTPEGVHIRMNCGSVDGLAYIVVQDNGGGIPLLEREKVFRRLYRMDKSRTTPGSGLGLSMAKAIAELHGASVVLEDAEPGLRVKIVFAG